MSLPHLIDFGPCPLHIVHNSFSTGLAVFPEDLKLAQFEASVDQHVMLKHGKTRWLTLKPCIDRVIEQWTVLEKYFADEEKNNEESRKSEKFKKIRSIQRDPTSLAKLHFVSSVAVVFVKFESSFLEKGTINPHSVRINGQPHARNPKQIDEGYRRYEGVGRRYIK